MDLVDISISLLLIVALAAIAVCIIDNEREIKRFFRNLKLAKFKIVNNNEGLYPIYLYRRRYGFWVFEDSYQHFEHAHNDIEAIIRRSLRGFSVTSTYYSSNGSQVQ